PQVEVPVISPFSPPPGDFRSYPSPVATVQAVSPPRAMAADAASSSAEQGTATSTTFPPAPKKRRRKHMLSDYKRILKRMTEDMPTGQEPDRTEIAALAMGWWPPSPPAPATPPSPPTPPAGTRIPRTPPRR
ncbi:unnamed protein product, partial [Prorocentrum cordatum]